MRSLRDRPDPTGTWACGDFTACCGKPASVPGSVGFRNTSLASLVVAGLLSAETTSEQPDALVRRAGRVVAQFDHRTQDSGNVSWLVETADGEFFVKTAGTPVPF